MHRFSAMSWLRARFLLITLLSISWLSACGGGGGTAEAPGLPPPSPGLPAATTAAVPDNRQRDPLQVLIMGNSHASSNDLPGLLAGLLRHQRPAASVEVVLAPGFGFLDELLNNAGTRAALESRRWSHVILQGQKYSVSAQQSYPTEAAQAWIGLSKALGATPLLFPEHGQRGNAAEGQRVFSLHQAIAAKAPACVAPIGPAWDATLLQMPGVMLHSADGNHAALAGSLLTALVFYELITGMPASALPHQPTLAIEASLQQRLREQASAAIARHGGCVYGG